MEKDPKTNKREIILLDFSYDTQDDLEEMASDPELINILTEDIVLASKEVIENNLPKIHLYDIGKYGLKVEMKREQFKPSLEFIKNRYIKTQEFEKCAEIQELINKI